MLDFIHGPWRPAWAWDDVQQPLPCSEVQSRGRFKLFIKQQQSIDALASWGQNARVVDDILPHQADRAGTVGCLHMVGGG